MHTVHIKSVIKEHPKTSHKISKTIRQARKANSNRVLYSDKKSEKFLNEKNVKLTKREHALKAMQLLAVLKF